MKTKLLGSRQILNYFISFLDEDGSLKNVPGWNFTDWVPDWKRGVGPMAEDGTSALMYLQLLLALQSAIILENTEGLEEYVLLYEKIAKRLEKTIKDKYWDESKNLFADTPQKDKFSQHANSLAILAGLAEKITCSPGRTKLHKGQLYFIRFLEHAKGIILIPLNG